MSKQPWVILNLKPLFTCVKWFEALDSVTDLNNVTNWLPDHGFLFSVQYILCLHRLTCKRNIVRSIRDNFAFLNKHANFRHPPKTNLSTIVMEACEFDYVSVILKDAAVSEKIVSFDALWREKNCNAFLRESVYEQVHTRDQYRLHFEVRNFVRIDRLWCRFYDFWIASFLKNWENFQLWMYA
jgi:hypothetical protein